MSGFRHGLGRRLSMSDLYGFAGFSRPAKHAGEIGGSDLDGRAGSDARWAIAQFLSLKFRLALSLQPGRPRVLGVGLFVEAFGEG